MGVSTHVSDSHSPLAGAGEVDRDRLLVLIARLHQRRQRLRQLILELAGRRMRDC
jgi:hypothetical protein